MKVHANAALGPAGRLALVEAIESGMTQKAAAAAFCVAPATAHRWWHRWEAAGEEEPGTTTDGPRPGSAGRTLPPAALDDLEGAPPPRTLRRPRGERQTFRRYKWSRPGALLHMDVKRLARFAEPGHAVTGDQHDRNRGAGREYLHVVIDDHSRLAYVERHPREDQRPMP
jgi:transposase-like protein